MADDDITERRRTRALKKLSRERRYSSYFEALGEFVWAFAAAEFGIYCCLFHHTKVGTDTGRAVFSGVRAKEGIGFLRRLAQVHEIDAAEWVKLEPVLDHFSIITDKRNKILHHGVDGIEEGEAFTSNIAVALTWERIEETPVRLGHLRQMTYDLYTICYALALRHSGPVRGYTKREIPRAERRSNEPWSYTPPPPKQNRRPQRDKSAGRRRLHRSCRG